MSKEETEAEYDDSWDEDEDAPKGMTREEYDKLEAYKTLGNEALSLVNESIRARNTSTFSSEIKKAYNLYNTVAIDKSDTLLEDWEGNRAAVENGSKVVQNIIRQITNDGASQLGDMLYPNDQDNYGVIPIIPAKPPFAIQHEPAQTSQGQELTTADGNPITHLQAWEARKTAINHRVERMAVKIDNNLEKAKFGKIGRRLILDAAITGTCILKGPYADLTNRKSWIKSNGSWDLDTDAQQAASFKRISVLDFLPDMSAEEVEDCVYISTREWYLPRNMQKLATATGYNTSEVIALLKALPREGADGTSEGDNERQSIKDAALVQDMYSKRYEVFETWADFEYDLLKAIGVKGLPAKSPPNGKVTAAVVHCQGRVLRAFLNPLKSGDLPFSVWCWDSDPTSIFGKGVPVLAENCQLIYNSAWRMVLDHGGLSAMPMVGLIQDKIEPATGDKGDYSLRGGKVWLKKKDIYNVTDGRESPFEIYDIPIHLDQFFAIMEKAEEDAYKLTGVTRVNKNEAGVENAPVTLGATSIFQNNSSVSRRRQVRDFDDVITKNGLTMLYDWLMQFEKDDEIKAPMEIEPRGSSVLMQREVNTQNLMQLYNLTQGGAAEGAKPVEMLREIQAGMQFPEGRFVEGKGETEDRRKQEAENPPIPPDVQLENDKLQLQRDTVEANVEIDYMKFEATKAETEARIEMEYIDSERKHFREMSKLQLMTTAESNKNFIALQNRQDNVTVNLQARMAEIQSKRDIAASASLQRTEQASGDGTAKMITAIAKDKEADTKAAELSNKVAGTITAGV